jgi:predicted dienelactone hydrolase
MAVVWFFYSEDFAGCFESDVVSIIGHSMGGYTALAAAGGLPVSFSHESQDGASHLIEVTKDPRIKSLVLLAPATVWFNEENALNAVDCPILLIAAEKDQYTPPDFHAQIVLNGVPDQEKIQYRVVENAGHFSFLSPFPETMIHSKFLPSQDPPGFNREYFQEELNAEITDFLMRGKITKR